METVLQRPVPNQIPHKKACGAQPGPGTAEGDLPELREGIPSGVGDGEAAAVLQRWVPDFVVRCISQSES